MKNLILPFVLLLTFVFSCRENDIDEGLEKKTASYDVYVAGKENNSACYWKNGIKIDLINGSNITPRKIIVENNDVYIFAMSDISQDYYIWKNNVKIAVNQHIGMNNNTTNPADYAHSIDDFLVDQGNIYLFGIVTSPIVQIPSTITYTRELCYWKNGLKTVLFTQNFPNPQNYVTTRNFTIYNGDVYIPVNKMLNNLVDSPIEVGYFKNNSYNIISPYSGQKNFRNISSNGLGDIYLSMYDKLTDKSYFKNIITNTDSYISQTVKGKFKIDGTDIYDFSNGSDYLKNDNAISFSYALGFNRIEDFFALDQNIYQIRSKSTSDIKDSYKVYINNVETQHINHVNGIFTSIYVVQD
ncbi:hypothetical protein ACFQO9_05560 [Chryseobacterium zhengzhouense]|uniref:DUF4221 domain-containing protein n=1 Tax=Chryseobacterium zhengzhouense TaxID=1636086 RepID=A0ABW2LUE3_9FLAO